jgi:hypothetical protein
MLGHRLAVRGVEVPLHAGLQAMHQLLARCRVTHLTCAALLPVPSSPRRSSTMPYNQVLCWAVIQPLTAAVAYAA